MVRLPIRYFDEHATWGSNGSDDNRYRSTLASLQQAFAQIVMAILSLTMAVIMMFVIDWQMALVGSLIIPISYVFARYIIKHSQSLFDVQQKTLGDMFAVVQRNSLDSMKLNFITIKKMRLKNSKKPTVILSKRDLKQTLSLGLMSPGVTLVTYIVIAISVFMGAMKVAQGVMVVGALQSFVRYIWQVNQPLAQITQLAPTIQSSIAAMDRVFEYLEENDDVEDIANPVVIDTYEGACIV
ncbi:hypothetical protein MGH68_16740 [Erysipelothrix sp. D19-032]